jgi:sporulation protein YlmC with PRC-barrel domain
MDIPLNVNVYGPDGQIGRSTYIIVNPVTQEVTHVVISDDSYNHTERLVSVRHIRDSDSDMIRLDCGSEEVAKMEPFEELEFIPTTVPDPYYLPAEPFDAYAWPYVTATEELHYVKMVHRHIPPYEREIRRGAHVHASDGQIGQVDELVIDRETLHITYLVLREGHLWGQKDIMIPVDEIETINENNIYLKLDKLSVETLPTFPVHHHVQH